MLDADTYRTALVEQADGAAALVDGADPALTVPTCPEWTLADLAGHVGAAHRWAAEHVRREATGVVPFEEVPDTSLPADPAAYGAWLRAGVRLLRDGVTDPDRPVWTPFGEVAPALVWLRRMTHETAVHRVDAALTVGETYLPPAPLAADGIDEFVHMLCSELARQQPQFAALRGGGQRLTFRAEDTGSEWYLQRGAEGVGVAAAGPGDVTVSGPVGQLLLVLARRAPAGTVTVTGDGALFDHWREHTAF